jgi:hypothetical protein
MTADDSNTSTSAMENRANCFPPLEAVNRPTVTTEQAAYYLNRKPQTLREWACLGRGDVRPLRVCGRLAWPVADLRRVLGVAQ